MCPQMLTETKDTDLTCLHVPGSDLSLSDSARGGSGHKPFHACKSLGDRLPAPN